MKHNLAHFVIHIYGLSSRQVLEIFYTTVSRTNKDVGFKLQNQEKTDGLLMQNGLQLERACPILGPMIPRSISFNLSTSISISMHLSLISLCHQKIKYDTLWTSSKLCCSFSAISEFIRCRFIEVIHYIRLYTVYFPTLSLNSSVSFRCSFTLRSDP